MSRLIVKNLPAYLSDVRLREHFSQKGSVTDVKLMTRPDGTSRRFGFVGYRSEEEARDALDYFNRTFIDTSRIQVDLARKIGDEGLIEVKEKRKATRDGVQGVEAASAAAAARDQKKKEQEKRAKSKASNAASSSKGVSFEEFMAVMAPKKKRKTWQNEEDDPEERLKSAPADEETTDSKKERKRAKKEAKVEADAAQAATTTADANDADGDDDDDNADMEQDEALNDEGLTDLDYMAKRMRRNVGLEQQAAQAAAKKAKQFEQSDSEAGSESSDSDQSDEESDEEEDEVTKAKQEKERLALEEKARKDQEAVDTIMGSGRLFIRNLPFSASEEDLEQHFAVFGPVKQVHITLDKTTKSSKGMAFVHYHDPAHALSAYRGADGTTFQGRLLHLLPAVDLRPKPEQGPTLKQSRAEERKAKAGQDFNWSSLYMSADAVASSVAERLGISKSDILNPSDDSGGDSAAVRLALAETKVIRETKEFLEREGIDVSSLEGKKVRRSDTTILVKNIPFGTAPETIREMFERHGDVDRVLIPPAGTIALVEMVVPGEARVAFRALAYKRVGNSIVYLEKAPEGMVKRRSGGEDVKGTKPVVAPPTTAAATATGSDTAAGEADVEPGATLFVKNLSFATTDAKLTHLFSTLTDFAFARVQTRIDSRDPSKRLSMGYGFVGFRNPAAAQTALGALQGKELDGHALALSFARRGQDADDTAVKGAKEQPTTKLIVKNLPFETTRKDVRALFAAHGQVKSVRVPRKAAALSGPSQSGARGFAFVEFTSKREAQGAFEALRHAHFLGRHLVLQWDREDEKGVDGLREKVRESFAGARQGGEQGRVGKNKAKLKLGQDDIAEAAAKERAQRDEDDE
ncbi:hypothetical protein BDZ90DRAFT_265235 [Jaminaea rosea]|uniref:RRM domain-containing protein n=1 Tax=Jaminaea rosea TaxID=1569628 RepID=A0A316ULY9_9BASI|nr:hypothetical protein BDZ90DRAFT_265235 [Jaminaea rosea]PWN26296.1 hypothetical protein BDZ90DRAFT_265235 [Jaminaea rosea]